MNDDKIYLDKKGFEEYLSEIEQLKEKIKINSIEKGEASRSASGDGWHDNFDYEQAEREQRRLINLIDEKKNDLNRIEVVEPFDDTTFVDVDDFLMLEMCLGNKVGECRTVKLIGSLNPNMENKIREITINSPLGKAVYGSKVGDCVEYCVNGKIISVIIRNKSKNINELLTNSSFRK